MPESTQAHQHNQPKRSQSKRNQSKRKLRSRLRARRRALSTANQFLNAHALQRNFLRTLAPLRFQSFAAYLPADGEIDTRPLLDKLFELDKSVALPVLHRSIGSAHQLRMSFAPVGPETAVVPGAFGLLEPAHTNIKRTFIPDVLLMPAVAIDHSGTRLGMGGGFYDRYLAQPGYVRALRIGLVHDLQMLPPHESLPRDQWDQPLDAALSNIGVQVFNQRAATLLGVA